MVIDVLNKQKDLDRFISKIQLLPQEKYLQLTNTLNLWFKRNKIIKTIQQEVTN